MREYDWDEIIKVCKYAIANNMQIATYNGAGISISYRGTDEIFRALQNAMKMKALEDNSYGNYGYVQIHVRD